MWSRFLSLGCLAALCLSSAPVTAGTIGLSWNPSAGASGYRVYYGTAPGEYQPTPIYDGPATSAVIDNPAIEGCQTGHFTVTAYNPAGESGFSTPISSRTRTRPRSTHR